MRHSGMLLIQTIASARYLRKMAGLDPSPGNDDQTHRAADLARRLKRYRLRVEAEGRQRSVRAIDRAIEDIGGVAENRSGKVPKGTS